MAKKKPASVSQCITPDCTKPVKTRGLCIHCYATANAKVKKGDATWEYLEEVGLALPSRREKGKNLFDIAFKRKRQGTTPLDSPPVNEKPAQPPSLSSSPPVDPPQASTKSGPIKAPWQ